MTVIVGDIRSLPGGDANPMPLTPAACVIANPPFLSAMRADPSPVAARARAHVEGPAALRDWIDAALRMTRPRGWIVIIHRADRLDEILAALQGRAGDIAILPLWPKAGTAAKRVLVGARPAMHGPLRLLPGLILHRDDGRYGAAADAVLRGGGLDLWPERAAR